MADEAQALLAELYERVAERENIRRCKSELSYRHVYPLNPFFVTLVRRIETLDREILAIVQEMRERGKT